MMATYTFTCNMGHDEIVFSADATSDEEVLDMIFQKAKAHLEEKHTDMRQSDEEIRQMIKDGWKKMEM